MRLTIIAVVLAASCAAADAKPKAPIAPPPAPALPEFADAADAAKVLEAKAAMESARLRFIAALEEFERKHKIRSSLGEGWDEVDREGKPCTSINDCRLRLRRLPPSVSPSAKTPEQAQQAQIKPPAK